MERLKEKLDHELRLLQEHHLQENGRHSDTRVSDGDDVMEEQQSAVHNDSLQLGEELSEGENNYSAADSIYQTNKGKPCFFLLAFDLNLYSCNS